MLLHIIGNNAEECQETADRLQLKAKGMQIVCICKTVTDPRILNELKETDYPLVEICGEIVGHGTPKTENDAAEILNSAVAKLNRRKRKQVAKGFFLVLIALAIGFTIVNEINFFRSVKRNQIEAAQPQLVIYYCFESAQKADAKLLSVLQAHIKELFENTARKYPTIIGIDLSRPESQNIYKQFDLNGPALIFLQEADYRKLALPAKETEGQIRRILEEMIQEKK